MPTTTAIPIAIGPADSASNADTPATSREATLRRRLRDDFGFYAKHCLKIRTKPGAIEPLILNRVQRYLYARAEDQLKRTGKVRLIILKGRQEGCSTFVEARFFHKVTHNRGRRAFILTHHSDATANLFGMAKRFLENLPEPMRPIIGSASQRELSFEALDSGYRVGTAGTEGVGRSSTIQYCHCSEVGFWPSADEHAAGLLQAVPKENGTEVWFESTANGIGGLFHRMWSQAETGRSEYEPVFVPWFWLPEYATEPPPGWKPESDEAEIGQLYDLTAAQLYWRNQKILELGSEDRFRQEYPNTAPEAFQVSGANSLIRPPLVAKARKLEIANPFGSLLIGVDPARFGEDGTGIAWRKGRKCTRIDHVFDLDTMEIVALIARIIDEEEPRKVFIDVGGLGAGICDRLRELRYGRYIVPVNFGETALDETRYYNRRSEMWCLMRDWFADKAGVQIPDSDELHGDLTGPEFGYDSLQRTKLETKEHMMKVRKLRSPDLGDALALTFAVPVHAEAELDEDEMEEKSRRRRRNKRQGRSFLSS